MFGSAAVRQPPKPEATTENVQRRLAGCDTARFAGPGVCGWILAGAGQRECRCAAECAKINRAPERGAATRASDEDENCRPGERRKIRRGLSQSRAGTWTDDRGGGRRDRATPRAARADHCGNGRARAIPPAAAALVGRRRTAACRLCPGRRRDRQARRQRCLVPRPGLRLHDDRGVSDARSGARDFRRRAGDRRLGPAGPGRGADGAGRLSPERDLELCERQPPRDLARRPCRGLRRRRHAAPAVRRQPGLPYPAVPKSARGDDRHLACHRSAWHRQRQLYGD